MDPVVPSRTVVLSNVLQNGGDKRMKIVTLVDRRPSAPSAPREWLLQADLEDVLYPSVLSMGTAGAFYRLLKRAGAGGMSMSLRHTVQASKVGSATKRPLEHVNLSVRALERSSSLALVKKPSFFGRFSTIF